MEIEHTEPLEILPANIGSLPATEAAPLLSRAASRTEIIMPKTDFWKGMGENLRGAAGWIEAQRAKLKGKTLNIVATASLVGTMVAACSRPPETPYLPTEAPRVTEVIPTETPLSTETPTQEPTPTIEPSPTPTEIPTYSGPLIEVDDYRGSPEVTSGRIPQLEIDLYSVRLAYPVTLVRVSVDPETGIGEEIWGFRLDNQDHLFRTNSAVCDYSPENPEPYKILVGVDASRLELGRDYWTGYTGFNEPIQGSPYWEEILSHEVNSACRTFQEGLRIDPADTQRLVNFFRTGEVGDLEVDEEDVVDLTEIAYPYDPSRSQGMVEFE